MQDWAFLDHGVLYVATEHALTFYDTRDKALHMWRIKLTDGTDSYTYSDYFNHIYGMDTREHTQAYLAAGREGIYVVDLRIVDLRNPPHARRGRLITRERYSDLPTPVLDVRIAHNKLYILCGELNMQNVEHNESIRSF